MGSKENAQTFDTIGFVRFLFIKTYMILYMVDIVGIPGILAILFLHKILCKNLPI